MIRIHHLPRWVGGAFVGVALSIGMAGAEAQPRAPAAPPKVKVDDVVDYRGAGENALLIVGLGMKGVPENVERLRVLVSTATDSVGGDLLKPAEPGFRPGSSSGSGSGWEDVFTSDGAPQFDANLKNPARQAVKIARLEGVVELLLPKRDPDASLLLNNWRKYLEQPLEAGALARNNISLRVLSDAQFEALPDAEREPVKREVVGNGPDSMWFVLSDPEHRLAVAQFLKPDGSVIEPNSYSYGARGFSLGFAQPLPPDARLKLLIATPKATVKVPFSFSDIVLP